MARGVCFGWMAGGVIAGAAVCEIAAADSIGVTGRRRSFLVDFVQLELAAPGAAGSGLLELAFSDRDRPGLRRSRPRR